MTDKIVVLSTCQPDDAERIARHLVERQVAACVNIIENARSIYRWKDEVADDREALLVIKSRRDLFPVLHAELRKVHNYDVPELIALPVVEGAAPYLAWLDHSLLPPIT
jgi:periplasmic divalent cation tolerance protein